MQGAIAVAETGATKAHVFNSARQRGYPDDVADVELVFKQDEDAIDHVLEDGLRAQADAYSEDTGTSEQRRKVYVEDGENVQQDDEADDAVGGGADDGGHGAELRGALRVADLPVCEAEHPVDEELDDAGEDKCQQEYDGDAGKIVLNKV